MSRTHTDLKSSAALLTGVNVACAVIGVLQGLLVLRMLGPELFGAAAVLVAIGAVAANLVDVRVTDLVSRLYYDERACLVNGAGYRGSALRLGVRVSAGGAALIALVSGVAMPLVAPALTGVELFASWFWFMATAQGIAYLGSFFIFVQRYAASPPRMAAVQVTSALINAAAMVGCVAASRTVGGYTLGLLASATGIAILNAAYAFTVFRKDGIELFRKQPAAPSIDRATIIRFLSAGNLLGYVKLLHRSADVLLVSVFCGDRETGIYKLARSIADALFAFSEAMGRVYQPRLLELLQARDHAQYAVLARSLLATATVVTLVALLAELTLLPHLAPMLGVTDVRALTLSTLTLSVSFFFAAGLQSWIWPAFIFFERLGQCTLWGIVAVLAGQYVLGPVLFHAVGDGSSLWFCVGYLSFYPLSLVPLWRELQRERSTFAWRVQEVATP